MLGFLSMKKYIIGLFLTVAWTVCADVTETVTKYSKCATAVQAAAFAGWFNVAQGAVIMPIRYIGQELENFQTMMRQGSLSGRANACFRIFALPVTTGIMSAGAAGIGMWYSPDTCKSTFAKVNEMDLKKSYGKTGEAAVWTVGACIPLVLAGLVSNSQVITDAFKK